MRDRWYQKVGDRMKYILRRLCGRLTPGKRVFIVLTMCIVFGGASIYVFVSSIYHIGKYEGQRIEIEHMNRL